MPLQPELNDPGTSKTSRDTEGQKDRWTNVCSDEDRCYEEPCQPDDISHVAAADVNIAEQADVMMEADPIEQVCLREKKDMNNVIDEKMIEIAHILGLHAGVGWPTGWGLEMGFPRRGARWWERQWGGAL